MYYTTELYHHGIKGQKWGVRHYQNEDGSLTNAGLRRYKKEVSSVMSKRQLKNTNYITKKLKEASKDAPFKSQGEAANVIKNDISKALNKEQHKMLSNLHEKAMAKDATNDDVLNYMNTSMKYGSLLVGNANSIMNRVKVNDVDKQYSGNVEVGQIVGKAVFDIYWHPGDFDHVK